MSYCFKGKTVIITGASSGIGQGAAIEFAKLGANLILGGRNVDNLQATKNMCVKEGLKDNQIVLVTGEIEDQNIQKQLVDEAINKFGQLDILVNNAGMVIGSPVLEMKMDDFDKIHNVNLRSAVALTLLALPHLIKTKGNVVNISSVASLIPMGSLAYGMSKAGMDMFTKCLAFEVAPQGVRVNSVNPGAVPTNIARNRGLTNEEIEQRYKRLATLHPLGRNGEVKEVVDSIIFLASEKSSFVTGQLIAVGGGIDLGGVRF